MRGSLGNMEYKLKIDRAVMTTKNLKFDENIGRMQVLLQLDHVE